MAFTIAIAGKGGTGKTTLAALLVRYLREHGGEPILAVDADPNANLGETLGMRPEVTIAELLDEAVSLQKAQSPAMTKEMYIEYRLHAAMVEGRGVDLLVMGGPEGPGCYCYANNLLRHFMDELSGSYRFVVMDNEAGLEHLSRRTTDSVDVLLVTSDPTVRGLQAAARIDRLTTRLKTRIGARYLVVTRAPESGLDGVLEEEIARSGMSLLGVVPYDPAVVEFDMAGRPFAELPGSSPAVLACRGIFDRLMVRC
ncbi:MAG: dehydrogenase maturation factor [Bacillota bacterium]|nr:dehydrogenase maturation factor [Bacillota bacterium]